MSEPAIPTWIKVKMPPCICRIMAKSPGKDGRVLTDTNLMQKTGWGNKRLRSVYRNATWEQIEGGDMDLFLWACGLHPSQQRRYMWVLQRAWKNGMDGIRRMRHLRADTAWQKQQVNGLLQMVERVLDEQTARKDV